MCSLISSFVALCLYQSGKLGEYRDLEDRVFPRCCCCKWEEINAGTNAREPEPNLLHIVLVLDVHIWR